MMVSTEAPAWWAAALPPPPSTRRGATRSGEPPKHGRESSNPGPCFLRNSHNLWLVLTSLLFPRMNLSLVRT